MKTIYKMYLAQSSCHQILAVVYYYTVGVVGQEQKDETKRRGLEAANYWVYPAANIQISNTFLTC